MQNCPPTTRISTVRRLQASAPARGTIALATALALSLLLAACGGGGQAQGEDRGATSGTPSASGTAQAPERTDADLVIWAGADVAGALRDVAERFGQENDLSVAVQPVPIDRVSGDQARDDQLDGFLAANAASRGPDIVVGPHSWIGTLVQNGAIEPVRLTETDQQRYAPLALDGVTYSDRVYGLPYAYESLALFRNTSLVAAAPSTIEELAAQARSAGTQETLCLPLEPAASAYHLYPLYSSAGGSLFGTTAGGAHTATDLGVGKRGSLQAAVKLGQLGAEKVLDTSITSGDALSLFVAGRCPFLEAGPDAVAEVRRAGVPYAVSPMVGFAGMEPARPLTTVQALFVASKGEGRKYGQRFVLDAANSPQAMRALYDAGHLPPAMTQVLAAVAPPDPDTAAFAAAAAAGQLMPVVPQTTAVWEPLGRAEVAILDGADPTTTMTLAGADIAENLN
jgi:arabinogalactan oligomer / maltooligosaccharide transport system substrate-binding protein